MSDPRIPAVLGFKPPHGPCLTSGFECEIAKVARDLCRIASYLQRRDPFIKLVRHRDWYNHDGSYFECGSIDFHGLFQLVRTPRDLLAATPDDDYVHVGVVPEDRRWYLRFRVEWDKGGETLIGHYSITLGDALLGEFESEVIPDLECPVMRADPGTEWASLA